MKTKFWLIGFLIIVFVCNTMAQTKDQLKTETPEAVAADVASVDSIIRAVYDVISGKAGKKRDWNRFNSLFHKDARLIPTRKNPETGAIGSSALTAEGYIAASGNYLETNGFFEKEISRKTDVYGNIAHVFSTYAAFHKADDQEPFMRGINSFQLFNDGKRWWVMTIYWQAESKENPIPTEYLPGRIEIKKD